MAEGEGVGAKVRVVRCPKCDNLLPELANFTVYRCGGCDATLQAKKQPPCNEPSPEKSSNGVSSKESMKEEQRFSNREALKEGDLLRVGSSVVPSDCVNGLGKSKAVDKASQVVFSNGHSKSLPKKACQNEVMSGQTKADSSYPLAGPSNFNYNPIHDGVERQNIDGFNRVELLEQDRAELMRKLDELRDQIKRSVAGAPKPEEKVPANGRGGWIPDGFSAPNCNSVQYSPFSNGRNAEMPRFYPSAPLQNSAHGCRETCRPYYNFGHYSQSSSNGCIYGQLDPGAVTSYQNDGLYQQPICGCMQCYNGHWPPAAQLPAAFLGNQMPPPCSFVNHGLYSVDGRSHGHNHRAVKVPLHPYDARNLTRSNFPGNERRPCRPVAGAAPFIVCYNCSELLQVPDEILQMGRHRHKLRCGSCSQLIAFELEGRRLVTSENSVDIVNGSKDVPQCHGNINRRQVISYSIDYDSPSYYGVQSTEEKVVMPSFPVSSNEVAEKEGVLNISDLEKLNHGLSSSSSTSEGVESPDCVICPRDGSDAITRVPSLPLREHFVKQNSVKDVPVATEMDVSAEDYPNAGFSHDSWDASKDEEEQHRGNKGGESFLAGLIKKSFKDLSRFNQSTESGRPKVLINGHSISERLVKRAEKLAGPIHSGDYWYDYRAGFWGVIGHACLGIIPPFIEEFNYPLSKNCADGNTGVVVNGRELNEKDLALLSGRGLPVTGGRSYIIEISGRIWDEETGEELDSLGKLAPTVERVKRGFGMRAPRVVA